MRRVDLAGGAGGVGVVTTLAGSPTQTAGHADGVAKVALFNSPYGVAVNPEGTYALIVRRKSKRVLGRRGAF